MEGRYNGWANYETWAVKLWMDNEEGSCLFWESSAEETLADAEADETFTKEENAILSLAGLLQAEHEEALPDDLEGVFSDLLNATLGAVDWHEIAESLIGDVSDDEDETSEA